MVTLAMRYSFVIPVYNRPEELEELLGSIVRLRGDYAYEVVIVEDGSTRSSEAVVARYRDQLPALVYLVVPNGGPSRARNLGVAQASGEYVLILDSDVVLPEGYLAAVDAALQDTTVEAFGGPDAASPDFSPVQQAINYAMTSP